MSRTTGIQVSWEDIQSIQLPSDSSYLIGNYNAVEVESTATNSGANNERAPLTFAELTALIQSGQTDQIPNNEQIPEGTNVCPAIYFYGLIWRTDPRPGDITFYLAGGGT